MLFGYYYQDKMVVIFRYPKGQSHHLGKVIPLVRIDLALELPQPQYSCEFVDSRQQCSFD